MQQQLIQMIRDHTTRPHSIVEIGVCRGVTSKDLIGAFPKTRFLFVDPWKEWSEGSSYYGHKRLGKLKQNEWEDNYETAKAAIGDGLHTIIFRGTSEEASKEYAGCLFSVVFIDANHTYESVLQDIQLWRPMCTQLICGHDYGGTHKGVKRAVHEVFGEDRIIKPGKLLWGVDLTDEQT